VALQREVTVVIPALNEEQTLPELMATLEKQTLKPAEVIIVDGGSTDGTCDWVENYARSAEIPFLVRLLRVPGARPGRGRNVGATAAQSNIIACSDCGVQLQPQWLEQLTAPLDEKTGAQVAVGAIHPKGRTPFERCVGDLVIRPAKRVKLLYAGGTSVAFFRSAWERVGGYPDDVFPCEDAFFLRNLRDHNVPIARAFDAISEWRPRVSLAQLRQQFLSYAWGDAMIGLGWHRHLMRIGFYGCVFAAFLGAFTSVGRLIGIMLLTLYLSVPIARAWMRRREAIVWFWGPLVLLTKDLAQICGYAMGHWNRLRGGARDFGRRKRLTTEQIST
jgi:glycosyltransferase involved in cell wall biosynthesis